MAEYCEIILIRGSQCSLIVKILLVREDVISRVNTWSVILQCKAILHFVKRSWGRKFVGKGNLRNPRTLNPHEQ